MICTWRLMLGASVGILAATALAAAWLELQSLVVAAAVVAEIGAAANG